MNFASRVLAFQDGTPSEINKLSTLTQEIRGLPVVPYDELTDVNNSEGTALFTWAGTSYLCKRIGTSWYVAEPIESEGGQGAGENIEDATDDGE